MGKLGKRRGVQEGAQLGDEERRVGGEGQERDAPRVAGVGVEDGAERCGGQCSDERPGIRAAAEGLQLHVQTSVQHLRRTIPWPAFLGDLGNGQAGLDHWGTHPSGA